MSSPSSARVSKYPLLRFTSNVDWKDVDPEVLQKLSMLAARNKVIVTVFSGYRSDKYSQQVGGFAGDPHTRHIAVDANVGGKPIGSVIPASEFKAVGLITGNQPNFYNGKPDAAHVQLGGSSSSLTPGAGDATQGAKDGAPGTPSDSPPLAAGASQPGVAQPPIAGDVTPPPDTQPLPGDTRPFQASPGSGMDSSTRYVQDLWSRIQPGGPNTAQLQQNALGG